MEIDKIIELNNNKKYLLLLKSDLELEGYFLAVLLDEKEEPTNTYAVLKEVKKDGKIFTQKIDNVNILNTLLEDYKLQYEEMFEEEETA